MGAQGGANWVSEAEGSCWVPLIACRWLGLGPSLLLVPDGDGQRGWGGARAAQRGATGPGLPRPEAGLAPAVRWHMGWDWGVSFPAMPHRTRQPCE